MSLTAIDIISRSFEASVGFYTALGVLFRPNVVEESPYHIEGMTTNGLRLMFDSHEVMRRAYPGWVPTPASSSVVLTFEQATPEAVDAMVSKLRELSTVVKVEPWDTFWGQRYAVRVLGRQRVSGV